MARLILSWNIKKDDESNYFEFIVQEYLPELMKLGMRPTQAWYTLYGEGPQIISTAELANGGNTSQLRAIVRSDEWTRLREKLDDYVSDFKMRIAR